MIGRSGFRHNALEWVGLRLKNGQPRIAPSWIARMLIAMGDAKEDAEVAATLRPGSWQGSPRAPARDKKGRS